jgi:hypothetical protein
MEVTEGGGPSQRGTGDLVVERDQKTIVKSALVNMWDHRQFGFRTFLDLDGMVAASVLPAGDGTARVLVSNGMQMPLTDCSISYGQAQSFVGNLAPGESKTIKVSLNAGGNPGVIAVIGGGQSNVKAVKEIREALAGVVSTSTNYSQYQNPVNNGTTQPVNATRRTPFVLTGWYDRSVTGLSLEGETPVTSGATLLVVHLPDADTVGTAPNPPALPPAARTDPFSNQGFPNVRRTRVRSRLGTVYSPQSSRKTR